MTSETRARILEAALDTFCEKGYSACVDDIARRAGVVKQTLYHHYGSKESLFREALTGLVNVLLVDLGTRSGSLREDLLRFAESFQAQAMSEQGLALHRWPGPCSKPGSWLAPSWRACCVRPWTAANCARTIPSSRPRC